MKLWSDGVARGDRFREPDEHRLIRNIASRYLVEEFKKLSQENKELRKQLGNKYKAKAAGAK